jgi:Ca2+-binding EF-hand superfamily protein
MSGTPIPILVLAVTFGIVILSHEAGATPRQSDDGQTVGALESRAPASRMVALGVRRVAIADPDLDGVVSQGEAEQYYETRFALMDRDRDGRLSEPEFFRTGTSRSLQEVDSFSDPRPLSFEAVDVDGSGALTPEEFLRADVARRTWAIGADGEATRRSIFDAADANGDGVLSKQELTEAASKHFAGSDGNGDGRVTIWEFYGGSRF